MSYKPNNQERFELLDAVLRRDVPPEEPLSDELTGRIVAAIRTESGRRGGARTFRRFAICAALAASVLLAIALLMMYRPHVNSPRPNARRDANGSRRDAGGISPERTIVDDSLTAVENFAADSVAQEMRHLARDASDIGSAVLASLPGDVQVPGQPRWWSGLLEK